MSIFKHSDKKGKKTSEDFQLDIIDFTDELHGSLNLERLVFGKFHDNEIYSLMAESNIFDKIRQRGYANFHLETDPISDLDNRIYIKTDSGDILVHIRLKIAEYFIKVIEEERKMIFIDWLLTQNINLGRLHEKKILFDGQEYPGLNIFKELTDFIGRLMKETNAYGIFNVPEYFHDAVLFQKDFKFVDPEKQGLFKALLKNFKHIPIRNIGHLIQNRKVFYKSSKEVFEWRHGEMLCSNDSFINEKIFNKEYFEIVEKYVKTEYELENSQTG